MQRRWRRKYLLLAEVKTKATAENSKKNTILLFSLLSVSLYQMGEDVGVGLLLCICDSGAGFSVYTRSLIEDYRISQSARFMFTQELGALTKWLASRMLVWLSAGFST
jgi:hypothetical protein